jgi:carbonic anhydrase
MANSHNESDLVADLTAGLAEVRKAFAENPSLHNDQHPKYAGAGCADSRVLLEKLLNAKEGDFLCYENIGGSLEDPDDPTKLSKFGTYHIAYASHKGVGTYIIVPHGKCGCMDNAKNCADGDAPHGHGLEAKILAEMGDGKKFAVDLVKKEDAASYLTGLGITPSADKDTAHLQAIEVAHGLHQAKLAKDLIKALESPMKLAVVYFDVGTGDAYVSPTADVKYKIFFVYKQATPIPMYKSKGKTCGCGEN